MVDADGSGDALVELDDLEELEPDEAALGAWCPMGLSGRKGERLE
jgi:hypothetical protein